MKRVLWWLRFLVLGIFIAGSCGAVAGQSILAVGAIQGGNDEAARNGDYVTLRGIVTGQFEDQNTRGVVYYTIFVQEPPAAADGDPATSDGIAVFLGRQRPYMSVGDQVLVSGRVTEFYGFTEIDDKDLAIAIEARGQPLPPPVLIDPPADMAEQAAYFEALEGMRVAFDGPVVVAGPTHAGCGFAVIDEDLAAALPLIRRALDDPVGQVVPVLYPSDLDCRALPPLKTGDRIAQLSGVVVYNFDQFKIVLDAAASLDVTPAPLPTPQPAPELGPEQIRVISFNLEDYFDTQRDTDEAGEPVLTGAELELRQAKMVAVLADRLACPTLAGLQEVENAALLADLAAALTGPCGFRYDISHLDSPDGRGIDNALLSDPRRVTVTAVSLRQVCSPVPTGISDDRVLCEPGQQPLFGRPPLHVEATIDDQPYTIFVNHFKSKRGGATETELARIRQAVYLNELAGNILDADPSARIMAMGDFNDIEEAPAMLLLADPAEGGRLVNVLDRVPDAERYTYNFGGVSELLDTILLSPSLAEETSAAVILHTNTDFPAGWRLDDDPARQAYRVSDHDIPIVILGDWPLPTPTPTSVATSVATDMPVPTQGPTQGPTQEATPVPAATSVAATPMPAATSVAATAAPSPTATPSTGAPPAQANRVWPWVMLAAGLLVIGGSLWWGRRR